MAGKKKKDKEPTYDFVILGADGMQGSIVARDLLERGYAVFLADIVKLRIDWLMRKYPKQTTFQFIDLRDADRTIGLIHKSGAEVVINCAEGDWNLHVYRACIASGRHCVDLGSRFGVTADQFKLSREFKKIGRVAITGCGSVPGIGNVMLAHAAKKFDSLDSVDVGFAWNSNIKKFVVPFSIESILEEYTLKAPYLKESKLRRMRPADSAVVRNFRAIGPQKIFLADHPEIYTFHHYFRRLGLKNIRFWAGFPEHAERTISTLIDLTFANTKEVHFDAQKLVPMYFLAQMLKRLQPPRGYKEWENLWVDVTGSRNRKRKRILMECIVPPLKGCESVGCNIDTGFPAAIIAEMIKYGDISKPGSFAPEAIVPEKKFFKALKKRKFQIYENGKKLNS